jgi:fibronectin type 3 domain-containing protein
VRLYRRMMGAADFSPVAVVPVKEGGQIIYTDTSRYFSGYTLLSYTTMAENTSYALSEFSDTVSVYPISETKPYSPINVTVAYENGSVNLIWDDMSRTNPEITGYRVYRKVSDPASMKQKDFTLLSDKFLQPEINYYSDTLVVSGNTYEYQVRSVDFKGAESSEGAGAGAVITLQKPAPVAPSAMKLFAQTDGIMIEWEEPEQEAIKSYRVYRYERGGKPTLVTTVSRGTERFTDITARKGKLYFYYLTSVHQNGNESVPGREEGIWK